MKRGLKMYKILVADDEKEIADAIKIYLEDEGYQVIECLDGKEALKIVKTTEIHLALLDIMMPKIDGITLAREIRKISTMPIIFISAKSQSLDKITFKKIYEICKFSRRRQHSNRWISYKR